jgi:hypothetical protein
MASIKSGSSILVAALAFSAACAGPRSVPPTPPTAAQVAQLWVEPVDLAERDLFAGPWGLEQGPDPAAPYTFVAKKKQGFFAGFSPGYTVRGPGHVEWSAKQGPEAQAEVTASRLVWALGFHQPAVYFLEQWTLAGGDKPGAQTRARFRPKIKALDKVGEWGWLSNPFMGTPAHQGLLVMMVMLNNSDLKSAQNVIYDLERPREGAQRWYVVQDLGHSFGETGKFRADRNDIVKFETEAFTKGVEKGRVKFNWSGFHGDLLADITPADVHWTCERLGRLTDAQWQDAFRAGGYEPTLAERYIRRFKQKIAEGLALPVKP